MTDRDTLIDAGAQALAAAGHGYGDPIAVMHATAVLDAVEPLLREHIAQQIAAIDRPRTHWDGCHEAHDMCAAARVARGDTP